MKNKLYKIAPSILAADPLNIERDALLAEKSGAYRLSVDVMDGHFVSDITFGSNIVLELKKLINIPVEVHLMVSNPDVQIDNFINTGADVITFHYETGVDITNLTQYIKNKNVKAGLAISPDTNIENLSPYLKEIDEVTVMTVIPGKGGQSLILDCLKKIQFLTEFRKNESSDFLIQVDGGVKKDNITHVFNAGADIAVAGTAIFNNHSTVEDNMNALFDKLKV